MQCHRIEELLELLQDEWLKEQDLNLLQFLQKIATEAGYAEPLQSISDDTLIYQLEMIPGLAKDVVPDFKEALLRARGIIK